MLTIRLSRTGKRHKPQYRIVLQEKGRDPWSPAIEILGNYNPHTQPSTVVLKEERIKHWLEKGAQPSNTVHNMLVNAGLVSEGKAKSVAISDKRKGKLEEKAAEAAEKAKEAEEAKKAAEEAAKAEAEAAEAAEAPAEEAAPDAEAPAEAEEAKEEAPAEEETPAEEAAPEEAPAEDAAE